MQLVIKRKKFYYLLTILTLGAAAEVLKGQQLKLQRLKVYVK